MAGGMSVADIISEDIVFEVSHSILQVSKTISSVIIIVLQYIYFIRNAVNLRILPCIIILSFCFNVKITIITTNLNASTKQIPYSKHNSGNCDDQIYHTFVNADFIFLFTNCSKHDIALLFTLIQILIYLIRCAVIIV